MARQHLALPPSQEVERALLGAIIQGAQWIPGLSRELFNHPISREVWDFLDAHHREGGQLDLVTVLSAAQDRLSSRIYLEIVALPGQCISLELVPGWIRRLREIQQRRQLVALLAEAQDAAKEGDWERATALIAPAAQPAPERVSPLPADRSADPATKSGLRARKKARPALQADFVLRSDPRWQGRIWWDDFRKQNMLGNSAFQDEDCQRISIWLSDTYRIQVGPDSLRPVVAAISKDHSRDPLSEYLRGLIWDGEKRLDSWLIQGVGAEDTPLVRLVGRRWAIQAVARALDPGCKADAVLVLTGPQGAGKSTSIQTLAGVSFFSDSPILIGEVRGLAQVHAAWIHEIGEMASISKKAVEETKQFITTRVDIFTPLYGRAVQRWPRRAVFCGTTNDSVFLTDPTGERRFWPVKAGQSDISWIAQHRDQLWAEAVAAYTQGETWHLGAEEEALIGEAREEHRSEDPWLAKVRHWLSLPDTALKYRIEADSSTLLDPLTTDLILDRVLQIPIFQQNRKQTMQVGAILTRLGYSRRRVQQGQGDKRSLVWAYEKNPA